MRDSRAVRAFLTTTIAMILVLSSGLSVATPASATEKPTDLTALSAQIAAIEAQMADPAVQAKARAMLAKGKFSLSTVKPKAKKPDPNALSFGGCGFLRNCIYFNRTEQRYIAAGAGAAIAAAICIAGTPAACVVAAAVVAVANVYINDRGGICSGSLRVQWFPYPGRPRCA